MNAHAEAAEKNRLHELIIGTMERWLSGEPVWSHDEIIARWGREFMMYRRAWDMGDAASYDRDVARQLARHELRGEAIRRFGFAIPCRELLDALAEHQPIVEIGAGSGYMTTLMRQHGIDVIGTDPGLDYIDVIEHGRFDPMQICIEGKTAVRRFRDRTVFCSWPSLNGTWFRQALRAMRIGQRIILVEEDSCGDESTWDYRDACFAREADVPLPAWMFMNDRCNMWIKMRTRQCKSTN
jgi:hypothetical protein